MSNLRIGRVVLAEGADATVDRIEGGQDLRLQYKAHASTLATTIWARQELDAQEGVVVPVSWSDDPAFDGYFLQGRVRVRGDQRMLSLAGTGEFLLIVDLEKIGSVSEVLMQSILTGAVRANDHAYATETEAFLAPPRLFDGFQPAGTSTMTRATAAGNITIVRGVGLEDHPRWGLVDVADFYQAGCFVNAGGFVRAGMWAPHDPTGWEIGNELVRVTDHATAGRITVEFHDGTAFRQYDLSLQVGAAALNAWKYGPTIIENRPERVLIRLDTDRASGIGLQSLYLGLRRGSRVLEAKLTSDITQAWRVQTLAEIGTTTGPPTGTMMRSADDGNGHRWLLGSPTTSTFTLTSPARMDIDTAAKTYRFMWSLIHTAVGPAAGDDHSHLWGQYMAHIAERVRAVRKG